MLSNLFRNARGRSAGNRRRTGHCQLEKAPPHVQKSTRVVATSMRTLPLGPIIVGSLAFAARGPMSLHRPMIGDSALHDNLDHRLIAGCRSGLRYSRCDNNRSKGQEMIASLPPSIPKPRAMAICHAGEPLRKPLRRAPFFPLGSAPSHRPTSAGVRSFR